MSEPPTAGRLPAGAGRLPAGAGQLPAGAGQLEVALRSKRSAGRKLLVPYITGGCRGWELAVQAAEAAGADAIEIGIPFSDPVMDGPVIQQACSQAIAEGATTTSVLEAIRELDVGVPLAVMTYYNLCYHLGEQRFAQEIAAAGVAGVILPDLPLVEASAWLSIGQATGVETILLAAPTTPDDHLAKLCEASRGFVYAVGLLGVTGARDSLAKTATQIAGRCKAVTDKPVLCGVGIGSPTQAVEACEIADGVVIGSAVMNTMLTAASASDNAAVSASGNSAVSADGNTAVSSSGNASAAESEVAAAVEKLIAQYRKALDDAYPG